MKYNNDASKESRFEYFIVLITLIFLIIAICFELGLSKIIPLCIISKASDIEAMMNTLFTVLSSVSVLGITLISIIAQISSETAYGISFSSFIMQLNPKILKQNRCLIAQMAIVLFAYISLSLTLYHVLFYLFIVSILITVFMLVNLFQIFKGSDITRQKIRNYIINNFNSVTNYSRSFIERLISNLQNDTTIALQKSDLNRYKDNLSLLEQLLIDNSYPDEVCEILEGKSSGIFIDSFKTHNSEIIVLSIKVLVSIYNNNNQKDTSKPLTIWENCSVDFFSALPSLSAFQLEKSQAISFLHWLLLTNVQFVEENSMIKRISGDGVSSYMGAIYLKLFRNSALDWSNEDINKIKKELFKEAVFNYNYSIKEISKNHQQLGRANLTNLLISYVYNKDEEILSKTMLKEMSRYVISNQEEKNVYLCLSIYFYYLACVEQIEEAQQLSDFARSVFKKHAFPFYAFLGSIENVENISKELIEQFAEDLRAYEIFPEDGGKRIVMQDAVNEFLMFTFLHNSYSYESLNGFMEKLILGKESSFFSEYLGKAKQRTIERYKKFYELCLGYKVIDNEDETVDKLREVTTGKINIEIDQLEAAVSDIYQKREMSDVAERTKPASFFKKSKDELEELCRDISTEICASFNANIDKAKLKRKKYSVLHLNTSVEGLSDIKSNQFFNTICKTYFVGLIINLMKDHISLQNVDVREREKLTIFFEQIKKHNPNVDTLVGYRDWYWGDSKIDDFRAFEATKTKIKVPNIGNILIAVQKGLIYCKVTDVYIEIDLPNINEMFKPLKKNADGLFLFDITSDISLPFSESELKQYISNKNRVIRIYATVEYGFGADIIGAGINITTIRESESKKSQG